MKSVGLFTIYVCNYGAVLQTFALKKYLEDKYKDVRVSVVDFYSYEHYRIMTVSSKNFIKKLMKYALILTHYPALYCRNKRENQIGVRMDNAAQK